MRRKNRRLQTRQSALLAPRRLIFERRIARTTPFVVRGLYLEINFPAWKPGQQNRNSKARLLDSRLRGNDQGIEIRNWKMALRQCREASGWRRAPAIARELLLASPNP